MGGHVENSNLLRLGSSSTWRNRYFLTSDKLYLNNRINKLSQVLASSLNKKFFFRRNVLFSHLTLNFSCSRYSVSYYLYDPIYEIFFTRIFGRKVTKVLLRFYSRSLVRGKVKKYRFYREVRNYGSRKYFSNLKRFKYIGLKNSKYKILNDIYGTNNKKFTVFLILIVTCLNVAKMFDEVYVNKKPRQSFPIVLFTKLNVVTPVRAEVYNYALSKTFSKLNKFLFGMNLKTRSTYNNQINSSFQNNNFFSGSEQLRFRNIINRLNAQANDYNVFFFNLDQTSFTAKLLVRFVLVNLKRKFRIAEILYPMLKMILPYVSGFKIIFSGRFNRAPRAHYRIHQTGKVPLNSFWYKLDYSMGHVPLKFGDCSVRIWISKFFGTSRLFSQPRKLGFYSNNFGSLKPYYLNRKIRNVNNFMVKHPYQLFSTN